MGCGFHCGLQESIKASREWFIACQSHAAGLAVRMASHMSQLPTYDQQLHIIYLANDILVKRQGHLDHTFQETGHLNIILEWLFACMSLARDTK